MKVLVLGADGMLGHQITRALLARGHEVSAATRRPPSSDIATTLSGARFLGPIDAEILDTVVAAIALARPDAVVNGIGIVKQRQESKHSVQAIRVNSLFPHQLYALCKAADARLIHFSTDCVFSGLNGKYRETDIPDPIDLYGRSKLLGEVHASGCLTLRTSIIGLELRRSSSLVEWFIRQKGPVAGWRRALYSGLTTLECSRLVATILEERQDLDGLWHLSSSPISKYDLLLLLRDALRLDIEVVPDDTVEIDRSLDSTRFRAASGYEPPPWEDMITELAGSIAEKRGVHNV